MVKSKKEISTEEAPIKLTRRHTVVEDDKDCNLAEPKLKSISRSSSTSGLNQIRNKQLEEILRNKQAVTTLSPEVSISPSNASTIVITDSELSSSWIYSSKKAQIKTSPVASNFKSSSRLAERNEEMRSPMLPKSKMKAKYMTGRQTKTSYCCNALIVLIIGVAALGILAAIASIYYIEYFASYNASDIQIKTTKRISQNSIPLKKVGHSLGEENQKILNQTELPGKTSEDFLFPDSSAKVSDKVTSTVKPSVDRVAESKNNSIVNETDSTSMLIGNLLNLTSQMINSVTSDRTENVNQINALFSGNPNLESHYSKLFESYQGLHSIGNNKEKSIESEPNELISEKIDTTNINDSIKNDSNSMQLLEDKNLNREEKINFDLSSAGNEIPFQLTKLTSIVKKDVTKDVVDETVKDSSVISEDTEDLISDASDVARDLSVAEDNSTDLSVADDDSPHISPNLTEEENLKDFPNVISNLSTELEFTQENMTKLNSGVNELENLPDGLENTETLALKSLSSFPEDNLETRNLFRTLNIDFEEDKIRDKQPTDPDAAEPLANLPIVGTANRTSFIPNFLSRLDRTWGFSNFLRNPDEDLLNEAHQEQISVSADDTDSVDLNLPILETDIAVPKPVEMSRRFGIVDERNDQSDDLMPQDMQFSLEKALDRLRMLDVNNVLPSSRQERGSKNPDK